MKTIQEVLNEYTQHGHTLRDGLKLTDGVRTWSLEPTPYGENWALRIPHVPGAYIGFESLTYTIIPNLRVPLVGVKVYKMLSQRAGDIDPVVSVRFYPNEAAFVQEERAFGREILWAERIDRCAKINEVKD